MIFCTLIAGLMVKHGHVLQIIRRYKYVLLMSGLILIILTFFFGTYPGGNGPQLWLGSGGVYFQPSELLKVILIFYLASYFSGEYPEKQRILADIFPTIVLVIASIILLIFQRDLGTALIFISIYILIIFAVYGKRRILLISVVILSIAVLVGYYAIDLVRIRFEAWVFPWSDPQTASYQIIQSIIAIAAGGIFGTGIGLGYPNLIPLSHSDFIFTAIAEEWGLVGSIGLLSLFAVILFQGISISLKAIDRFHRYLAIGLTSYLLTQSVLIIAGNIRLLPITGVTLPFMSYGGSSLLVSYIAFAILIIIEKETSPHVIEPQKPYRIIAAFFSFCLVAIAFTLGWWGFVHANDLQLRNDNARNLISSLYVKRGDILDRNNEVLVQSTGEPGKLQRIYNQPPLSNTIGFFHQKYGTSGIESSFDDYLGGRKGYPSQDIWFSYLLYDQPPQGRSIRTTIDADLQKRSDELLQDVIGGLVILNAKSGEILAISTSPNFDANQLDANWQAWTSDDTAPLLNRAAQGAYPIGGLIAPLLLSYGDRINTISTFDPIYTTYDAIDPVCWDSQTSENLMDPFRYGCAGAVLSAVQREIPITFFSTSPLSIILDPIDIGISTAKPQNISSSDTWVRLIFGKDLLRSNPLQMAMAFLPLNNEGMQVEPSLVSAIDTAKSGWVFLSDPNPRQAISEDMTNEIRSLLKSAEEDHWEVSAATQDTNGNYFWFIAGTDNTTNTNNYILAMVLEDASRIKATAIGNQLLQDLKNR